MSCVLGSVFSELDLGFVRNDDDFFLDLGRRLRSDEVERLWRKRFSEISVLDFMVATLNEEREREREREKKREREREREREIFECGEEGRAERVYVVEDDDRWAMDFIH